MSLFRILIILIIFWLVIKAISSFKRKAMIRKQSAKKISAVRCEHCGVYLQRESAYQKGDLYFCDKSHAKAFNEKGES